MVMVGGCHDDLLRVLVIMESDWGRGKPKSRFLESPAVEGVLKAPLDVPSCGWTMVEVSVEVGGEVGVDDMVVETLVVVDDMVGVVEDWLFAGLSVATSTTVAGVAFVGVAFAIEFLSGICG